MKEYLISIGFVKYGSCSCSGTYVERYKRLPYTVEIRPLRNTWSLKMGGVFQKKGTKDNINEII